MSRHDLVRAQRLVQLRDLALDNAMRRLAEATAALADAMEVEAVAVRARDDGVEAQTITHAALVDDPGSAAIGLARIARADAQLAVALTALMTAVEVRVASEAEVVEARLGARRARARRDAMADRADRLRRRLTNAREERTAIEAEEGLAAVRRAA